MKDDSTADGEDADGGEGEDLGDFRPQFQEVGEEGSEGTEDAERVKPHRRVDRMHLIAIAQAELHEDGGESDGRDNHDGERAVKGAASGEDDDEREGSTEQAGGDDGPAAGWCGGGQRISRKNIT